jgi:hypothetical protein
VINNPKSSSTLISYVTDHNGHLLWLSVNSFAYLTHWNVRWSHHFNADIVVRADAGDADNDGIVELTGCQAERQLVMMQRMRSDWDGLHQRLAAVETQIQGSGEGQNLLTLLATLAANAGVKPSSMEKRQSGESERYEETKVEVSLKSVSLQQAVSYLASIESAKQPLSVKSLRIKRRPGRSSLSKDAAADQIDVTFSVSAFKPR